MQEEDYPGKPGTYDNRSGQQVKTAVFVGFGNNCVNHDETLPALLTTRRALPGENNYSLNHKSGQSHFMSGDSGKTSAIYDVYHERYGQNLSLD